MEFKSEQSIYSQIADYLKSLIFGGVYKAGDKLPAIREFAIEMRVNPNTIVRVYQELEKEKLIYTESTSGKFVTTDTVIFDALKRDFVAVKANVFVSDALKCGMSRQDIIDIAEEIYGKLV